MLGSNQNNILHYFKEDRIYSSDIRDRKQLTHNKTSFNQNQKVKGRSEYLKTQDYLSSSAEVAQVLVNSTADTGSRQSDHASTEEDLFQPQLIGDKS